MSSEKPKELARKLIVSGWIEPNAFVGCSDDEIKSLESHFSVQLPAYYQEILKVMGKEDGGFLPQFTWTLKCLTGLTRDDAERCSATHQFKLEPSWFIFASDDCCFFFFDTLAGDDPPVVRWCDDDGFKKVFDTLSDWFADIVNGSVEGWLEMQEAEARIAKRDAQKPVV